MLSVNIPVYNIEVVTLVKQLVFQAEELEILFEIRVYDDGSTLEIKKLNREIEVLPNVVYSELQENLGRSAIRNKMGDDSQYEYLLFIDADSEIPSKNYLEVFLKNIKEERVLCGGTAYKNKPPKESGKLLRWIYGTNREAISAERRNSKKGFIITSNNFLIEKSVFRRIHFREEISKYGHEDTLLGYDLYRNGIEIFHIQNPVIHIGLEDSTVFLEKTKAALQNLKFISESLLANNKNFVRQVHFLDKYSTVKTFLPPVFLRALFIMFKLIMEKNLTGEKPSLFLFDLYKLTFYSTL